MGPWRCCLTGGTTELCRLQPLSACAATTAAFQPTHCCSCAPITSTFLYVPARMYWLPVTSAMTKPLQAAVRSNAAAPVAPIAACKWQAISDGRTSRQARMQKAVSSNCLQAATVRKHCQAQGGPQQRMTSAAHGISAPPTAAAALQVRACTLVALPNRSSGEDVARTMRSSSSGLTPAGLIGWSSN